MKQPKIEPGDVYTLPFSEGLILLQYVATGKDRIDIVRVFRVECKVEDKVNIAEIVSGKEAFFLHFALNGAVRKGIVSFVGHFDLPDECSVPMHMRTMTRKNIASPPQWFMVNVETLERTSITELTEDIVKLSPFGVWNDTFLIDRMNEGWSLTSWK